MPCTLQRKFISPVSEQRHCISGIANLQIISSNDEGKKSVLKSVKGHWRLQNEVNILKKYQARTPFLRPLEDEIEDPEDPPTIVLKHLDSDLRTESKRKTLSRPEIKQVGKIILEVLHTLHQDGMVHTGKCPSLFFCILSRHLHQ